MDLDSKLDRLIDEYKSMRIRAERVELRIKKQEQDEGSAAITKAEGKQ